MVASSNVVKIMTGKSGQRLRHFATKLGPSMPGMTASANTTSISRLPNLNSACAHRSHPDRGLFRKQKRQPPAEQLPVVDNEDTNRISHVTYSLSGVEKHPGKTPCRWGRRSWCHPTAWRVSATIEAHNRSRCC